MHGKGQDAPYETRPANQKAYADAEHEPYRKAIDQPQQRGSEITIELLHGLHRVPACLVNSAERFLQLVWLNSSL